MFLFDVNNITVLLHFSNEEISLLSYLYWNQTIESTKYDMARDIVHPKIVDNVLKCV